MFKFFKKIGWTLFRGITSEVFTNLSSQINKVDLEYKHIKNAKLLPNRLELLKQLPANAVMAELGVDNGAFSELLLNTCKPAELHLIDFWGTKRYNQDKKNAVFQKFKKHIEDKKVEIHLGLSTDVVTEFKEKYFDFIYIDTDHTYQVTKDELELYLPKMKPNGIIAGHDYIQGNWNGAVKYGVIEAVHEFCVKHSWELIYITTEQSDYPSFAIKRID